MRGTIGGRGGVVPPPPLENSKSNLDIKSTENMPYKIYSSISLASTIIPRTPPPSGKNSGSAHVISRKLKLIYMYTYLRKPVSIAVSCYEYNKSCLFE